MIEGEVTEKTSEGLEAEEAAVGKISVDLVAVVVSVVVAGKTLVVLVGGAAALVEADGEVMKIRNGLQQNARPHGTEACSAVYGRNGWDLIHHRECVLEKLIWTQNALIHVNLVALENVQGQLTLSRKVPFCNNHA